MGAVDRKFVPDDGRTTPSSLGEIEFLVDKGGQKTRLKSDHEGFKGSGLMWDSGFILRSFSLS